MERIIEDLNIIKAVAEIAERDARAKGLESVAEQYQRRIMDVRNKLCAAISYRDMSRREDYRSMPGFQEDYLEAEDMLNTYVAEMMGNPLSAGRHEKSVQGR